MEVDQRQCKLQRISNGNGKLILASKISHNPHQMNDEEEGDGKQVTRWGSSRIVRVSRASGGKDRHSKVLTSRGLRDRRVRLAVNTAIQFYDLQDRLGFDQPSKAVEWLLKAAESSIEELPPISTQFPGEAESENCGSGVCLSRCESRANAMEGGKESEKDLNPDIPQTTSFTELLGVGFNNVYTNQWSSSTMDYSTGGLFRSQVRPIGVANQEAFSIASDHLIPSDNSSGLNRGTLQSNSSSSLFTPIVGPPPNIFNGPVENHIQFISGFDAGLQLYYGKVEADQK